MGNCTSGKDVISGMNIPEIKSLKVNGMTAMIIELH
jgi:hypothetical protein